MNSFLVGTDFILSKKWKRFEGNLYLMAAVGCPLSHQILKRGFDSFNQLTLQLLDNPISYWNFRKKTKTKHHSKGMPHIVRWLLTMLANQQRPVCR